MAIPFQFADDNFFLKGSESSFTTVTSIIDHFGRMPGSKVNLSKSVVVGVNMDAEKVHRLASEVGCNGGEGVEWPLTYLGLPLGRNPHHLTFWDPT